MNRRPIIWQIGVKIFLALLLAGPLIALLSGLIGFPAPEKTGSGVDPVAADRIVFSLYAGVAGVLAYATGTGLTWWFMRCGILRGRVWTMWAWTLLCGLLAAVYFPLGTIIAAICLPAAFWKRAAYLHPAGVNKPALTEIHPGHAG